MNLIISIFFASTMWVQIPQWETDWSWCAVDIPDSSCHWYVYAPDKTFGQVYYWERASWFDPNGLKDIVSVEKETVV